MHPQVGAPLHYECHPRSGPGCTAWCNIMRPASSPTPTPSGLNSSRTSSKLSSNAASWPGFPRVRCGECGHDKLLAFSCKRRGFCPSCGARRMSLTAAHLVDRVIPHVPVRLRAPLTLPQSGQKAASRDARALVAEMATVLDSTFRREAMRTPALSLAGSMRVQGGGWPRHTPAALASYRRMNPWPGNTAIVPLAAEYRSAAGRPSVGQSHQLATASRRTVAPVATNLAPYVYRRM